MAKGFQKSVRMEVATHKELKARAEADGEDVTATINRALELYASVPDEVWQRVFEMSKERHVFPSLIVITALAQFFRDFEDNSKQEKGSASLFNFP